MNERFELMILAQISSLAGKNGLPRSIWKKVNRVKKIRGIFIKKNTLKFGLLARTCLTPPPQLFYFIYSLPTYKYLYHFYLEYNMYVYPIYMRCTGCMMLLSIHWIFFEYAYYANFERFWWSENKTQFVNFCFCHYSVV